MVSFVRGSFLITLCISCLIAQTSAFSPAMTNHVTFTEQTVLSMAGFGGSVSSKKQKKGASLPKLKAKKQWERYDDLKGSQSVKVGVRIKGEGEWMEVGNVRSADENIEMAIARQRALIAEHSKRLHVVQIPENALLEWGYVDGQDEDEDEWIVVDKSKGDDSPPGIEKKIGFEGISDPATGFYCYYHEGRVIKKQEQPKGGAGAAFKNVKGK